MTIKPLGDVHLGKRFKHGVPLARRGDRERMQWAEFEASLADVQPGDTHIQVGDLFDEAVVPYGVVYRAAMAYRRAAAENPKVHYALYRGNHDASKDVEKITAFRLFAELLRGSGIWVIEEEPMLLKAEDDTRLHVLIPWSPTLNALEMVEAHADLISKATVAWGHWDVDGRQAESSNYVPAARLKELGIESIITGHDHNARVEKIAGVDVMVTGSMQPYDHSQDDDGRIYVTRTLADVLADPDGFKDKALRVQLEPGEVLDVSIDCLQLTIMRGGRSDDEDISLDVAFEEFDFDKLLQKAVEEVGLGDDVAAKMRDKIAELNMKVDDGGA